MDKMRLIIIAAAHGDVRPIGRGLLPNPTDRALKSREPGKHFRWQPDTAIEFAQQMFMTNTDLSRDLSDPQTLPGISDQTQCISDGGRWGLAKAPAVQEP